MHLIDCETAESYLRAERRIGPRENVRVRRLSGGVSNEVLYVERGDPAQGDFVLKQARPQLRVADPWFCRVERMWREVETLRVCAAALDAAGVGSEGDWKIAVPQLSFEDRDNYLYAMSAAPPHEVWKRRLLDGKTEPSIAAACGRMLAALHGGTWRDGEVATRLRDRSFFDDLRIDPYYRRIAQAHPDLKAPIAELIDSLARHCLCLTHGDFSPKNLLVCDSGRLILVDFEVGHFGDPAFDLGFFLSHLMLKAFRSRPRFADYQHLADVFWRTYCDGMSEAATRAEQHNLSMRTVRNFAACMLARIDGKSKVEYLTEEPLRDTIRRYARGVLLDPPPTWETLQTQFSPSP